MYFLNKNNQNCKSNEVKTIEKKEDIEAKKQVKLNELKETEKQVKFTNDNEKTVAKNNQTFTKDINVDQQQQDVDVTEQQQDVDVTEQQQDVDVTEQQQDVDVTEQQQDVNVIEQKQDVNVTKQDKDLNEIEFLRTTMTTVMKRFQINNNVNEIFDNIEINENVFNDGKILSVYFKNKDGDIQIKGKGPDKIKCFPKTITIYCSNDDGCKFKIRWFYSKNIQKIHLASGLKQEVAANYLEELTNHMANKLQISHIQNTEYVLLNGLAQAKLGVNLYSLAKQLEKDKDVTFVYCPDNHASLKIYTQNLGTCCVHSTGKLLYMGAKNSEMLNELHSLISKKAKHWDGVPVHFN